MQLTPESHEYGKEDCSSTVKHQRHLSEKKLSSKPSLIMIFIELLLCIKWKATYILHIHSTASLSRTFQLSNMLQFQHVRQVTSDCTRREDSCLCYGPEQNPYSLLPVRSHMNFGDTRSHSGHHSEGTCRSCSGGRRCRCHHCMVRGRDEGGKNGRGGVGR